MMIRQLRARVSVGLTLILFGGLAAAQDGETQIEGLAPKLQLSDSAWDFGEKWYGEPAEKEITLRNVGTAPLRIINVRSSCGCTVARPEDGGTWEGKTFLPGESTTFKLSYNTKKKSKNVSQTVTIQTNDPEQPTVRLTVRGTIKRAFEIEPERVSFAGVNRDDQASKEIRLVNNLEETVSLNLKMEPEGAPFDAKLEAVRPGKEYKLTVVTRPPLKPGSNAAQLVLETGSEQHGELKIPVTAFITPRVQTIPTKLYVEPDLERPLERVIRVAYPAKTPVAIKEVRTSSDKIKIEQREPRDGVRHRGSRRYHEIWVSVAPGALTDGNGMITILTDDPEYAELEIPVTERQLRRGSRLSRRHVHDVNESGDEHEHEDGEDEGAGEEQP